jgi:hypothetical protein
MTRGRRGPEHPVSARDSPVRGQSEARACAAAPQRLPALHRPSLPGPPRQGRPPEGRPPQGPHRSSPSPVPWFPRVRCFRRLRNVEEQPQSLRRPVVPRWAPALSAHEQARGWALARAQLLARAPVPARVRVWALVRAPVPVPARAQLLERAPVPVRLSRHSRHPVGKRGPRQPCRHARPASPSPGLRTTCRRQGNVTAGPS